MDVKSPRPVGLGALRSSQIYCVHCLAMPGSGRVNKRRLLEPIGNIPPAEYEEVYYRSQETPAMVAGVM